MDSADAYLLCQECKGHGMVTDYPAGFAVGARHEECSYCHGTGKVTRQMRGVWLHERRQMQSSFLKRGKTQEAKG